MGEEQFTGDINHPILSLILSHRIGFKLSTGFPGDFAGPGKWRKTGAGAGQSGKKVFSGKEKC